MRYFPLMYVSGENPSSLGEDFGVSSTSRETTLYIKVLQLNADELIFMQIIERQYVLGCEKGFNLYL